MSQSADLGRNHRQVPTLILGYMLVQSAVHSSTRRDMECSPRGWGSNFTLSVLHVPSNALILLLSVYPTETLTCVLMEAHWRLLIAGSLGRVRNGNNLNAYQCKKG